MLATHCRIASPSHELQRFLQSALIPGAVLSPSPTLRLHTDIVERSDAFQLSVDLPGVDPADVSIEIKAGVLTLSGNRPASAPVDGDRTWSRERPVGEFSRAFRLSDQIDTDGIKATSAHGVLTLLLPKRPVVQPQKIQVQPS